MQGKYKPPSALTVDENWCGEKHKFKVRRGQMMKVKWTGETEFLVLTKGKVYEVISIEKGWYRIKDDSGEDYLYPTREFETVQDEKLLKF